MSEDSVMAGLLGGLLFGAIGLVAFGYGKRKSSIKTMGIGVVLMVYPYFVSNAVVLWIVGVGLTATLFVFRD